MSLHDDLIKLARTVPEVRDDLLPILKRYAADRTMHQTDRTTVRTNSGPNESSFTVVFESNHAMQMHDLTREQLQTLVKQAQSALGKTSSDHSDAPPDLADLYPSPE